jgi:aromatic ring-cleaving dioxygenase
MLIQVIPIREGRMPEVTGYHAHVYFNSATQPVAERLRDTLVRQFDVEAGAFSIEPRGPHPISQFNVIFKPDAFQRVVPWLMLNRAGLDVLVHPLTDDMYDDHSVYALWLGAPVNLKLDHMRQRQYGVDLLPTGVAPAA